MVKNKLPFVGTFPFFFTSPGLILTSASSSKAPNELKAWSAKMFLSAKNKILGTLLPGEIKFHLDQFYGGNIDGNDLANAIEEIVFDRVSFSDIREEDEPTDAEIKKADSVASAANKHQKLVKKMKDKAKDFKAAEGKAKEKIKDELKALTAEKKKLEKAL